jgi:predicted acylesterase/phospholipase RssA
VGRTVGLVLGGGGARAFAHVGAVRALCEAGVPIDVVGGTSAGAIIAAQVALGWDAAELYARNRQLACRGRSLIDYTLPLVALLQARRFTRLLHELFGDTCIEDLWLGFWCLSSNLTRAEKIVHQRGPLAAALRASCALPGVLPPVLWGGDVVVDGGLVDTVPVATMNELLDGAGSTIAVDVSAEVDLARDYAFGSSVSGVRLVWERLNPFAASHLSVPSMAAVLLRSIELGSVMHRREHRDASALFVKLPVAHVDRLAFDVDSFERLVEIGYTCTRAALQQSDQLAELTRLSSA